MGKAVKTTHACRPAALLNLTFGVPRHSIVNPAVPVICAACLAAVYYPPLSSLLLFCSEYPHAQVETAA